MNHINTAVTFIRPSYSQTFKWLSLFLAA